MSLSFLHVTHHQNALTLTATVIRVTIPAPSTQTLTGALTYEVPPQAAQFILQPTTRSPKAQPQEAHVLRRAGLERLREGISWEGAPHCRLESSLVQANINGLDRGCES